MLRLRTNRARVAQLKTANSDVEIMKRKVAKLTELVRTETDTGRTLRDFAPRDQLRWLAKVHKLKDASRVKCCKLEARLRQMELEIKQAETDKQTE